MTKKRVTAAFALLVAAALLVSLLPLLPFSMPQAVAEQWTGSYEGSYYDNLNENLDGLQFREQLAQLITDTHSYQTTYNELSSVYAQSDADPYNNGNVIWFYTGTSVPYDGLGGSAGDTNREHVWPKDGGRAFPEKSGPGSDAHHLRPTEQQLNSARGSLNFDEVAQTSSNIVKENGSSSYGNAENGVDALLQDMRTLYELVKRDHPAIPFILFGHSMGSLLARAYASRDGEDFDAFIFCGTAGRPAGLAFARFIARREARRAPDRPSRLLERLCFGGYNRAVGSSRTAFDWLSRDAAEVDRYVADPACGFTFTAAGMRDVLDALLDVCGTEWASRVPDAPILLASGDCDPVGGRGGGGVRQAAGWLRQSGHGTVELKLYPGARHELLNETNRDEVYQEILNWCESKLSNRAVR